MTWSGMPKYGGEEKTDSKALEGIMELCKRLFVTD